MAILTADSYILLIVTLSSTLVSKTLTVGPDSAALDRARLTA